MTQDLDKTEAASSNFREQILRDMKELKQQRFSLKQENKEITSLKMEEQVHSLLANRDEEAGLAEKESVRSHLFQESTEQDFDETMIHQMDSSFQHTENAWQGQQPTLVGDEEEELPMPVNERRSVKRDRESVQRHRKQQERIAQRIVLAVVTIVLLALAVTGYMGYAYVKSSLEPMEAGSTQVVQVEVPVGSSTKDIASILVENGLIKNATIFNYYVKLKSYNNFQGGFYNFNKGMSVDDLAKALQEGGTELPQDPIAGKVLIVEGYTIEQIATAITQNVYSEEKEAKTPFSKEEFLNTIKDPAFIARMAEKYPNLLASLPAADSGVINQLEGYLFPATYDYTDNTTIEDLVEQMLMATDYRLQPYYDQLASKGLNVNQLLTLASLVEKEGSTDEDRRNIASVFYNRINIDMPLQSNIAILYAMGKLGQQTTLSEDASIDTNIDSPYNIYVHTGLMPGPVASPSLSAIEATLGPNQTDYYYFVADVKTGTVYYSVTAEEHDQKVQQYVNSQLHQ